MEQMRAVCILRPTRENVALLRRELRVRGPRYAEYHLYFTNTVSDMALQELAEADGGEAIAGVHELYGDFIAADPRVFVAPCERNWACLVPPAWQPAGAQAAEDRAVSALASVVLSMKRKPLVRYQSNSEHCRRVAEGLHSLAYREEGELFDFGARGAESPPVVLVVDRLDDPVTPLLSQWTYHAMMHELLGVEDGAVDLRAAGVVTKEHDRVVFSRRQDPFFAAHQHADFGSLGEAVRRLMEDLARATPKTSEGMGIAEMKKVLEDFPEYRSQKLATVKHVECLNAMSAMIQERDLMSQGALEYGIAAAGGALQGHAQQVADVVAGARASELDKLRLLLLLALRYEPDGAAAVSRLASQLEAGAGTREGRGASRVVEMLLRLAGRDRRLGDLFRNKSVMGSLQSTLSQMGGTEWYRTHRPLLYHTLRDLAGGKLSAQGYPFAGGAAFGSAAGGTAPRDVVAFVVGGCTLSEGQACAQLSREVPGCRFYLGGTALLNARGFVGDLLEASLSASR